MSPATIVYGTPGSGLVLSVVMNSDVGFICSSVGVIFLERFSRYTSAPQKGVKAGNVAIASVVNMLESWRAESTSPNGEPTFGVPNMTR